MKRCGDTGRAPAPVVAGDGETLNLQRVCEIDDVLTDRRLFRHSRRRGVAEACGPVAAQIRDDGAIALRSERPDDLVVGAHIVREAVQQDDGEALRVARLFVGDLERTRLRHAHLWSAPDLG